MNFTLLQGDARRQLETLPANHFHTVVTSPPYWGLRDYGVEGQMGLEDTLDDFLNRMIRVFREVRRVMRPDGTLWLNIADSWAQSGSDRKADKRNTLRTKEKRYTTEAFGRTDGWERSANTCAGSGLRPKQMILQSFELARGLQIDGWWVRQTIIWHKPNPMPCGAQDRPALDFEYIFLLSPSSHYFYDQHGWRKTSGAKCKTTWTIPIYTYKTHQHNASFPPKLARRCILLGSSAHGVCSDCGAPWERDVRPTERYAKQLGNSWHDHSEDLKKGRRGAPALVGDDLYQTHGWKPGCSCGADVVPARVLDPFSGSGTTGVAALSLGREYTGIELNPEYLEASRERLSATVTGVPVKEARGGQLDLLEGLV